MEDRWFFLLSIVIIVLTLAIVFLSQQPYYTAVGENINKKISSIIESSRSNSINWFKSNIYPKVTQEIENRGEPLKEEVITQKDNAAKTVWEKIKNYFAEKFSKLSGTKVEGE